MRPVTDLGPGVQTGTIMGRLQWALLHIDPRSTRLSLPVLMVLGVLGALAVSSHRGEGPPRGTRKSSSGDGSSGDWRDRHVGAPGPPESTTRVKVERHIVAGYTDAEIADELGLRLKAITGMVRRLLSTEDVESRALLALRIQARHRASLRGSQAESASFLPVRAPYNDFRDRLTPSTLPFLDAREQATLRGLARGHSNKRIAKTLGYEVQTVKNTNSELRKKLGIVGAHHVILVQVANHVAPMLPPPSRHGRRRPLSVLTQLTWLRLSAL